MTEKRRASTNPKQGDGAALPSVVSPEAQQKASEILDMLTRKGIDPTILMEGVIEQTVMTSHRGPLPSPDDMRDYDRVLPGLAERIVARSEAEQKHRHLMNEKVFGAEEGLKVRGQYLAFSALLVMLGVVVYMVYMGTPTAAASLGAAIIASVVAAFIFGERGQNAGDSEPES